MYSSSKQINKSVIEMYKGKPHIKTEIVLYSPLESDQDLLNNFKLFPDKIEKTLDGLNRDVEDIIMNTFESDIHSIYSGVINLYK